MHNARKRRAHSIENVSADNEMIARCCVSAARFSVHMRQVCAGQAAVAQLAARRSHNPKVGSSILSCRKLLGSYCPPTSSLKHDCPSPGIIILTVPAITQQSQMSRGDALSADEAALLAETHRQVHRVKGLAARQRSREGRVLATFGGSSARAGGIGEAVAEVEAASGRGGSGGSSVGALAAEVAAGGGVARRALEQLVALTSDAGTAATDCRDCRTNRPLGLGCAHDPASEGTIGLKIATTRAIARGCISA